MAEHKPSPRGDHEHLHQWSIDRCAHCPLRVIWAPFYNRWMHG